METYVAVACELMGLVVASALLTYFTQKPAHQATTETVGWPADRPKKARKKRAGQFRQQQPYLLADGTVVLADRRPGPTDPAASSARPLPQSVREGTDASGEPAR